MLKNVLKSSVSVLVLLGMTTTLTPSYAGNKHSSSKDLNENTNRKGTLRSKAEEKNTPEKSSKSIVPFKKTNLDLVKIERPTDANRNFLINGLTLGEQPFHTELLPHIFTFLDLNSVKNAELVCKNWRWLVNKGQIDFRHEWNEKYKRNPENLPPFVAHPLNILWIFDKLAPQFPVACSRLGESISDISVPADIMDQFASALSQYPENASFLSQKFMQIDPLDIQEFGLAAHITKNSTKIQELLRQISAPLKITNPTKDPKIFEDPKNIPSLQKQLMALKLLTLCGDQDAQKTLTYMGQVLSNNLKNVFH